jgi:2,3-bisphosphoglycerate-dependent phosphoglycerate mutase
MNYLVLLRHGESQWNLENRFTGFKDIDLSENGLREAKEAGERLKALGVTFDQVFTSTQKRAYNTAQIALKEAGQEKLFKSVIKHDDLRERDYGELTGQNKDEAREQFGEEQVQIWRRSYDIAPPGGECLKDVVENRVRPYFTKNIKPLLDQGKNVLIAAHGNSLRATLIVLGQETPETINKAEMPTGVPLVFEMENGQVVKRYFLDEKKAA